MTAKMRTATAFDYKCDRCGAIVETDDMEIYGKAVHGPVGVLTAGPIGWGVKRNGDGSESLLCGVCLA